MDNDEPSQHGKKPKLPYFDLKEAYQEVRGAIGAKDTALAGVKLFGKGLFNSALYTGTSAVKKVREAKELREIYQDFPDAQLQKLRDTGRLEEKMAANAVLKNRQGTD
ncbi:hypothetical protein K5D38_17385 [Pseudomonas cichorii]|nr:hypothetical protein [Pseudomonas cichorii]